MCYHEGGYNSCALPAWDVPRPPRLYDLKLWENYNGEASVWQARSVYYAYAEQSNGWGLLTLRLCAPRG